MDGKGKCVYKLVALIAIIGAGLVAWFSVVTPSTPDSPQCPSILRTLLENLYYYAGIWLLITVVIGIIQLSVMQDSLRETKEENKKRLQREIASLTLRVCDKFAERLIFQFDNLCRDLEAQGIQRYSGKTSLTFIDHYDCRIWRETVRGIVNDGRSGNDGGRQLEILILQYLNTLEVFALHFTTDMCDKDLGYKVHGKVFCQHVQSLYPLIPECRAIDPQAYQPIIDLYQEWQRT